MQVNFDFFINVEKQSPDPLQTAGNVEDNETVAVQDGEEQTLDEQEGNSCPMYVNIINVAKEG